MSGPGIESDPELPAVLRGFTARSLAAFIRIDAHLEAELAGVDEYAVWGVGEFTMKLLATPALARRRLVALVDGNPARTGMRFGTVTVSVPDTLPAGVPVVVGSLLSGAAIAARAAALRPGSLIVEPAARRPVTV